MKEGEDEVVEGEDEVVEDEEVEGGYQYHKALYFLLAEKKKKTLQRQEGQNQKEKMLRQALVGVRKILAMLKVKTAETWWT